MATWGSIKGIIDQYGDNPDWAKYARPGGWNDPDMIVVGCTRNGLTKAESRTQMAIWSILAAPLMMSNNLRNLTQWQKDILQNREVMAIDQDELGKPGTRIWRSPDNETQVWLRPLMYGDFAVGLLNQGSDSRKITVNFSWFSSVDRFQVRDLWRRKDLGTFEGEYTAEAVASHGTDLLRLSPA
jgi:alpha-galactosidase